MPNLSTHAIRLTDGAYASLDERVVVGRPDELTAAGLTRLPGARLVCIMLDAPEVAEREQMTVGQWLGQAQWP